MSMEFSRLRRWLRNRRQQLGINNISRKKLQKHSILTNKTARIRAKPSMIWLHFYFNRIFFAKLKIGKSMKYGAKIGC